MSRNANHSIPGGLDCYWLCCLLVAMTLAKLWWESKLSGCGVTGHREPCRLEPCRNSSLASFSDPMGEQFSTTPLKPKITILLSAPWLHCDLLTNRLWVWSLDYNLYRILHISWMIFIIIFLLHQKSFGTISVTFSEPLPYLKPNHIVTISSNL